MFVLLHFHLEIHCNQSLSLSKIKFSTTVCTCACPCVGRWVWAGHTGAKTKIKPSQPKPNEPNCKPICLKNILDQKTIHRALCGPKYSKKRFSWRKFFCCVHWSFFCRKTFLEVVSCNKNICYNPGGPLSEVPSPPNPQGPSHQHTHKASKHPDPLTLYTNLPIQTKPTKTLPPNTKAQSPQPTKPWDTNRKLNLTQTTNQNQKAPPGAGKTAKHTRKSKN